MVSVHNCMSERWLRATKGKLLGMKLEATPKATSGYPTETPYERAIRQNKKTGTDE